MSYLVVVFQYTILSFLGLLLAPILVWSILKLEEKHRTLQIVNLVLICFSGAYVAFRYLQIKGSYVGVILWITGITGQDLGGSTFLVAVLLTMLHYTLYAWVIEFVYGFVVGLILLTRRNSRQVEVLV